MSDKDFKRIPWKSGKGFTTELKVDYSSESERFELRLSRAEIVNDGEFSDFSGYDRILIMIDDNGVLLEHNNRKKDIMKKCFDTAHFSGDWTTFAKLTDGAIKDFNIITSRDSYISKAEITKDNKTHKFNLAAGRFLVYSIDQDIDLCIDDKNNIQLLPDHLFSY